MIPSHKIIEVTSVDFYPYTFAKFIIRIKVQMMHMEQAVCPIARVQSVSAQGKHLVSLPVFGF